MVLLSCVTILKKESKYVLREHSYIIFMFLKKASTYNSYLKHIALKEKHGFVQYIQINLEFQTNFIT